MNKIMVGQFSKGKIHQYLKFIICNKIEKILSDIIFTYFMYHRRIKCLCKLLCIDTFYFYIIRRKIRINNIYIKIEEKKILYY